MESGTGARISSLVSAFESRRPQGLKELGKDFIEEAVVKSDRNMALASVIAYALYKILTKEHLLSSRAWPKVSESIRVFLLTAKDAAQENDENNFSRAMQNVIGKIEAFDDEMSNYARNIFEKGKMKQASVAYAMGLSLNSAAGLTGADRVELQRYIGATRIHDEQPVTKGIEERMRSLREVLGR